MLSGHDQFGNAVYNFGQGNFGQAAKNAGELIANVGGTIFSNTKFAGTKMGKRIAWPITVAEFGYTSWSVTSERLEFKDFETTRKNLEGNINEARSNLTQAKDLYRKNCN
jgi:hypothetical protein